MIKKALLVGALLATSLHAENDISVTSNSLYTFWGNQFSNGPVYHIKANQRKGKWNVAFWGTYDQLERRVIEANPRIEYAQKIKAVALTARVRQVFAWGEKSRTQTTDLSASADMPIADGSLSLTVGNEKYVKNAMYGIMSYSHDIRGLSITTQGYYLDNFFRENSGFAGIGIAASKQFENSKHWYAQVTGKYQQSFAPDLPKGPKFSLELTIGRQK